MSLSLVLTLLVSAAMHAALLAFGPSVELASSFAERTQLNVELVNREVPIPDALLPKPLPEVPLPMPLDLASLLEQEKAPARDLSMTMKGKFEAPAPGALPDSKPLPPPPTVEMPKPVDIPAKAFTGQALGADAGVREIILPARQMEKPRGLAPGKSVLVPDAERRIQEEVARLRASRRKRRATIAGPVAKRRILFRPKPPGVERLESTTEIVLRFWVLPDGTVGRVIPVRKASAYLEGVASNHLKRWRFSPLPPGAAGEEQWGEVTFHFRLR